VHVQVLADLGVPVDQRLVPKRQARPCKPKQLMPTHPSRRVPLRGSDRAGVAAAAAAEALADYRLGFDFGFAHAMLSHQTFALLDLLSDAYGAAAAEAVVAAYFSPGGDAAAPVVDGSGSDVGGGNSSGVGGASSSGTSSSSGSGGGSSGGGSSNGSNVGGQYRLSDLVLFARIGPSVVGAALLRLHPCPLLQTQLMEIPVLAVATGAVGHGVDRALLAYAALLASQASVWLLQWRPAAEADGGAGSSNAGLAGLGVEWRANPFTPEVDLTPPPQLSPPHNGGAATLHALGSPPGYSGGGKSGSGLLWRLLHVEAAAVTSSLVAADPHASAAARAAVAKQREAAASMAQSDAEVAALLSLSVDETSGRQVPHPQHTLVTRSTPHSRHPLPPPPRCSCCRMT